jgi:hypothetical protein
VAGAELLICEHPVLSMLQSLCSLACWQVSAHGWWLYLTWWQVWYVVLVGVWMCAQAWWQAGYWCWMKGSGLVAGRASGTAAAIFQAGWAVGGLGSLAYLY